MTMNEITKNDSSKQFEKLVTPEISGCGRSTSSCCDRSSVLESAEPAPVDIKATIDGEQKFACFAIPKDGMNIIVYRVDQKKLRNQCLIEYREGCKSGPP